MPIDSPFTPPHFSLTSGLGTEMEAFKSWYATSSPLFPCHCTTPIKEVTCYQWCRYKMGEPVSTWFHECLCGAQPLYTNTGCVPCFSERCPASHPIQNGLRQQFIVLSPISVCWLGSTGHFFCSSHLGSHVVVVKMVAGAGDLGKFDWDWTEDGLFAEVWHLSAPPRGGSFSSHLRVASLWQWQWQSDFLYHEWLQMQRLSRFPKASAPFSWLKWVMGSAQRQTGRWLDKGVTTRR